jgi:hypothetical protein
MAVQNEHGRLIAAAAKAALAPIGCVRSGQSRTWLSDQSYWAIVVEFQPSGWSKGSYLNVGACWLWRELSNGALTFNVGYRAPNSGFVPFESTEQFQPLIAHMASQAAGAVLALRAKFSSIGPISRYLNEKPGDQDHRIIHAAIAAGLNGEIDLARGLFGQIAGAKITVDWQVPLHSQAAHLAALLGNPAGFRTAVRQVIDVRRRQARLPVIADCLAEVNPQ